LLVVLGGLPACNFHVHGRASDDLGSVGPGGDDLAVPVDLATPSDGTPPLIVDMARPPDLRPGGFLSVSSAVSPAKVDLTAVGTIDWIHWATDPPVSTDRKSSGGSKISTFSTIAGSSLLNRSTDSPIEFSWSDGASGPGQHATNNGTKTSTYLTAGGYTITVPADLTRRRLLFYVGVLNAQGQMRITLSDGSADPYQDTMWQSTGDQTVATTYTVDFSAASPGQTLSLTYSMAKDLDGDSVVGIGSAALTTSP
jgi:hypothetical protein